MGRSKSPGARKGGGLNVSDDNVQLAITAGAICGLVYVMQGGCDHNDLVNFFDEEHAGENEIPYWPFAGFVMTMHTLNCCRNAKSGFWVNSYVNAYFATFASPIVLAILGGDWSSLFSEGNATLVFVCWYLTNHNLPVVGTDVWGVVSNAGGPILENIMTLCSLCTVTDFIIKGASTASEADATLGHSWFVPMAFGIFAGCAGDFFPLSKGITFKNSAAMERTMMISFFIASDSFRAFPVVGNALGNVMDQATSHFGGSSSTDGQPARFVMAITILNHLFGHFIPVNPMDGAVDFAYQISGLNRG